MNFKKSAWLFFQWPERPNNKLPRKSISASLSGVDAYLQSKSMEASGVLGCLTHRATETAFQLLVFLLYTHFRLNKHPEVVKLSCRVKAELKKCSQQKERRTRQKEPDKARAFWPPGVSGCEWRVMLVLWHANEALILTNALSLPSGNRATGLITITTGCCRGRRRAGPFKRQRFTVGVWWRAECPRVREVVFVRVVMKFLWVSVCLWRCWGACLNHHFLSFCLTCVASRYSLQWKSHWQTQKHTNCSVQQPRCDSCFVM